MRRRPISDALVVGIAARQGENGSWPGGAEIRPPLAKAPISSAALAVRALRTYAPEGRRTEMDTRVSRAVAFLRGAQPQDTLEFAFRLLGLMWGGAAADEVAAAKQALADLQRTDGGWAQLPSMDSDAYATGQALYAGPGAFFRGLRADHAAHPGRCGEGARGAETWRRRQRGI